VAEFITLLTGLDFLVPKEHARSNLSQLLCDPRFHKDEVISWFQENVPVADREAKPKEFLRSLTRAIAESSLNYDQDKFKWTLVEPKLEAQFPLLKNYVDFKSEREKQVLYALQHLIEEMEHPDKMLTFFCLYNYDVISEQGFEA